MKQRRLSLAVAISVPVLLIAAGCTSGSSTDASSTSDVTTLSLWDGWTQYNTGDSPYENLIGTCEEKTGITIERTVDAAVSDRLTQAASTGDLPNLVVLDNPIVAQYAETGILVDNETSGVDTSAMMSNVVASGIYDGKTYGAPLGSNTLALFYNTDMFTAAGLTPPTTWAELVADAQALTDQSKSQYGIAFSARPDAEGTFQFLPFFWGAGAELTELDSTQAVEALQLWTDLVADGYASTENVTLNQQEIRDQFAAGHAAMMVNGTWQLNDLDESGIPYAVVPIPAKDGGDAASPLGGEFMTIVQNSDPAAVTASATFVNCLVQPDNLSEWLTGQTYISPYADQAETQAADDARLTPWVAAVAAARSRTEDLGSAYATVATNLGEALSSAVAGQSTPQDALATAAAAAD